jgi:hypothetical protein
MRPRPDFVEDDAVEVAATHSIDIQKHIPTVLAQSQINRAGEVLA